MKVALLSMLCGIAIATITEPYGSNTIILEGKTVNEEKLPKMLSFMKNHIFSIQIKNKHVCTGIAYFSGHCTLMTTALCAMKIKKRLLSVKKRSSVQVCAKGLIGAEERCTSVFKVGINKSFLRSDQTSYNDENSALIEINELIYPIRGKERPETCIYLDPGDKLNVVGFEFFKEENETKMGRRLKYIVTCVIDVKECARLLNISSSKLPHSRSGACIKPCGGHDKFEKGDVGDPVYYNNMLFGIISDIGDDTKPAIMIRPGIPESDYDFSEEQLAKRRKLKEK